MKGQDPSLLDWPDIDCKFIEATRRRLLGQFTSQLGSLYTVLYSMYKKGWGGGVGAGWWVWVDENEAFYIGPD